MPEITKQTDSQEEDEALHHAGDKSFFRRGGMWPRHIHPPLSALVAESCAESGGQQVVVVISNERSEERSR